MSQYEYKQYRQIIYVGLMNTDNANNNSKTVKSGLYHARSLTAVLEATC